MRRILKEIVGSFNKTFYNFYTTLDLFYLFIPIKHYEYLWE